METWISAAEFHQELLPSVAVDMSNLTLYFRPPSDASESYVDEGPEVFPTSVNPTR